jgi:hypothetical protein
VALRNRDRQGAQEALTLVNVASKLNHHSPGQKLHGGQEPIKLPKNPLSNQPDHRPRCIWSQKIKINHPILFNHFQPKRGFQT